jgi:hypothetical protein
MRRRRQARRLSDPLFDRGPSKDERVTKQARCRRVGTVYRRHTLPKTGNTPSPKTGNTPSELIRILFRIVQANNIQLDCEKEWVGYPQKIVSPSLQRTPFDPKFMLDQNLKGWRQDEKGKFY